MIIDTAIQLEKEELELLKREGEDTTEIEKEIKELEDGGKLRKGYGE